ncbi:hypothetical protein AVEN_8565-1 [Araneus ventricosus]|uniref:Uncharacterized protein n=1 Tax=Araneus ventricosus TaxID=182803 RepID=A0A4Y2GMX9_ARAVE|nr:hypothetical protein AVEN_8565-1 [Araneus ventricosus]
MHPSDSHYDSSSFQAGVPMAIISHSPTLPLGGTHITGRRQAPAFCTFQGSEIPLTFPVASHPHGAPSGTQAYNKHFLREIFSIALKRRPYN